jgi:hypothetical protein
MEKNLVVPLDWRRTRKPLSQKAVKARIKGLPSDIQKATACALVGHSRIQTQFFGYFYCARCEAKVGDSLASVYPEASSVVIVGHDCPVCRHNAKTLTWRDTFMAPDPFTSEDRA